jgi:4,5-dihydroxyphthalate decarboxylase
MRERSGGIKMAELVMAVERLPFTSPILDGVVKPEGFDLQAFAPEGGIVGAFRKMIRENAFDACELGITTYLSAWDYDLRCTAIPVFLGYGYPQRSIVSNVASGISEPKDLDGKRFGARTYTVTGTVWARGLLADVYGVDLDSVTWVINDKEHVEDFRWPANVEYLPGADINKMLQDGEIDAGNGAASELLRPLFPDAGVSEKSWFASSGIYPMSHVIVVRNETLEANPGFAESLYNAFLEAKQLFLDHLAGGELDDVDIPFARQREIVGPDPIPFGIDACRPALEALSRYSHDQHITAEAVPVESMFVKGL